jgi:uncharacterized protein YggL (DUF469 family)
LTSWSSSEVPLCTHTHCVVPPVYVQLCKIHGTPEYLNLNNFSQLSFQVTTTIHITLHNKSVYLFLAHSHKLNTLCTAGGNKKKICSFIKTGKIVKRNKEQNYSAINTCNCRIPIKVTSTYSIILLILRRYITVYLYMNMRLTGS